MRRALMLFLLAMISLSFASSGQYLRLNWYPTKVIDGNLIALPVESGIDVLSLPDLSLVDHIDVRWPDSGYADMTMNNGRVAYIEEDGENEALRIYDLKNKESRAIKMAEEDHFYGNIVLSDDFIGYCEGEDPWDSKLYISSVDGNEEISKNFFVSANRFKGSWGNLFVIGGENFIGVYDPLGQKVIASTSLRKDTPYAVSMDGEWIVYTEAVMADDVGHDVWLWNYRTGEERLVSKSVDGKNSIDRQNYCIVSGDAVVWLKYNNASGKRDPAICMYSIRKNETKLVKKGELNPVDLDGNNLLLWDWGNKTHLIHDLSTGKEVEIGR